jgi:diguanylate cyclase (GGDEF)-like protein
MVKIFQKLKHILVITVILITSLFGLLVYRQYNDLEVSSLKYETDALITASRDISVVYSMYQHLSTTYYQESILGNEYLLNSLADYNTYSRSNNKSEDVATIILNNLHASFEHKYNQQFSYFKIYDSNRVFIGDLSSDSEHNAKVFTYFYPIYYEGNNVGYIEMGLGIDKFLLELQKLTDRYALPLYLSNESNPMSDLDKALYESNFYVEDIIEYTYMHNMTNPDREAYHAISEQIDKSIQEQLNKHQDFVIHESHNNTRYTMTFISMDLNLRKQGYFIMFEVNDMLTELHRNLIVSISLISGLYILLLFIIGFIYYILTYLYNFSYTDHLTRTYNRHKFFEVIAHNIYDYHRYDYNFTVILIDLDNFKGINDTFGHNTGDRVLIEFVQVLKDALRTTDYLFRWGGEEFLVLLNHCDVNIGYQVAEKLRNSVNAHPFNLPNNQQVSASFGVCSYDICETIEELISHADEALYYSKDHGKNQTTAFPID